MVDSSAPLTGPSDGRPPAALGRRLPATLRVAADHPPVYSGSTPASALCTRCRERIKHKHVWHATIAPNVSSAVPKQLLRRFNNGRVASRRFLFNAVPHAHKLDPWLATPGGDSKRRFLAYDLVGCVTCRQDEGCQVVEVAFHDQRGRQRVPHLSDYFGFTMAALGSKARPCLPASRWTHSSHEFTWSLAAHAMSKGTVVPTAKHALTSDAIVIMSRPAKLCT